MARKQKEPMKGPRFGAFLTMMVGLLLFFGMVSRIHDLPDAEPLSVTTSDDPRDAMQKKLEEERARALWVIGRREPMPEARPDETESEALPAPQETTPAPTPTPQPEQRPEPQPRPERRQETRPERRYHVVKPGDTLWGIAQQAYGDGNLHSLIKQANPGLDPSRLRVGQAVILPPHLPDAHSADRGHGRDTM